MVGGRAPLRVPVWVEGPHGLAFYSADLDPRGPRDLHGLSGSVRPLRRLLGPHSFLGGAGGDARVGWRPERRLEVPNARSLRVLQVQESARASTALGLAERELLRIASPPNRPALEASLLFK